MAAARTFLALRLSSGTEELFAVSSSPFSAEGSVAAAEDTSWAWVGERSPLASASSVASRSSSVLDVSMSLAASFGLCPVCFANQLSGTSSPSAPDTESSIRLANRMRAPASSRSSLAISLMPSAASAPVYRSGSNAFRNGVTPSRAARTGANRPIIGPLAPGAGW